LTGLDIFALIVLFILLAVAIAVWIVLAMLPGKIAKSRNHPQAEAINVGGWLGALLGGVFWPIILIWAFTKPPSVSSENMSAGMEDIEVIKNKLSSLEAKLEERAS